MSSAAATLKDGLLGHHGVVRLLRELLAMLTLPVLGGVFLSPPLSEILIETYLAGSSLASQLEPFVHTASAVAMFGMVWYLQNNIGHRSG